MGMKEKSKSLVSTVDIGAELKLLNRSGALELIPYARNASQEYSMPITNTRGQRSSKHTRFNLLNKPVWDQEEWKQDSWNQSDPWSQSDPWTQSSSTENNLSSRLKISNDKVGKQIKIRIEPDKAFVQDLRTNMIFLTTVDVAKRINKILNKTFDEAFHSDPDILRLFEYRKSA